MGSQSPAPGVASYQGPPSRQASRLGPSRASIWEAGLQPRQQLAASAMLAEQVASPEGPLHPSPRAINHSSDPAQSVQAPGSATAASHAAPALGPPHARGNSNASAPQQQRRQLGFGSARSSHRGLTPGPGHSLAHPHALLPDLAAGAAGRPPHAGTEACNVQASSREGSSAPHQRLAIPQNVHLHAGADLPGQHVPPADGAQLEGTGARAPATAGPTFGNGGGGAVMRPVSHVGSWVRFWWIALIAILRMPAR